MRAAVFSARMGRGLTVAIFTAAIALARKMLDLGFDPNAVASFGNTPPAPADGFSSTPLLDQVFLTV